MPTILSLNKEKQYPIIPIRNGIVFPKTESVLIFGRKKSVAAVEETFSKNSLAVVVMQKRENVNEPTPPDLYQIGTLVRVEKVLRSDDINRQEINALVHGISRVQITSYDSFEPFLVGKAIEIFEGVVSDDELKALVNRINTQLRRAVSLGKAVDFIAFMKIVGGLPALELSYQVSSLLDLVPSEKQKLLEENNLKTRLHKIDELLASELKVLEIEKNIDAKTQEKFDQHFKKTVLEERLKTIEKELGKEGDNRDVKEYLEKIKKAKMPLEVEKKTKEELKRFAQMSSYNPEASYLRTYLDWLTSLPWSVSSANNVEMKKAAKILDEDHFGLNKIKERIIEYLAVVKLKEQQNKDDEEKKQADSKNNHKEEKKKQEKAFPTILCFVGPPGVGKTSIGRSIARSLGRKFVKMSLGGIRDEAEIRGHRRTYVGALPGRIIQGIKTAGTNNPVFMLDEIDKVGTDFRGDPSSALLEALDPEQNYSFEDHYLEAPFDLSKVFFITTCNILDTIPPALRDRLEIIHFPGYTGDEKFNIAKNYLIGKQINVHALENSQVQITDGALHKIIERYTKEAGVRNLERGIATILRKVARKVAEGKKQKISISKDVLQKFLGPAKYTSPFAEKENEIGMSTGLAWTEAGGEILFIEVALMPGKGNLILTGQLGEVMKESCQAALSYVRSRYKMLGIEKNFSQKIDIHVHVPEGAVPKDGPSAGIAIATAIISAVTKTPVRAEIGMTGEITLRGRALEIGGVKEKIIAAHRAGLYEIIMPEDNKKDLEEIPKKVLKDLKFHYVKHMDEVLKIALVNSLKNKKTSRK